MPHSWRYILVCITGRKDQTSFNSFRRGLLPARPLSEYNSAKHMAVWTWIICIVGMVVSSGVVSHAVYLPSGCEAERARTECVSLIKCNSTFGSQTTAILCRHIDGRSIVGSVLLHGRGSGSAPKSCRRWGFGDWPVVWSSFPHCSSSGYLDHV